jgi:hypothetical protein
MAGILTAAQIVTLATQAAKCPGFTSQAGQYLNSILLTLCQTKDVAAARTSVVVTPTVGVIGPYNLPADFLRVRKNDIWFIDPGNPGVPQHLVKAWQDDFDMLIYTPGMASYPAEYTVDMAVAPPTISFWPPPGGVYPVTIRYMRQFTPITTPETSSSIPWFPSSDWLVDKLTARLCQHTGDDRASMLEARADTDLKQYLLMDDDPESIAKQVKPDPRYFKRPRRALLPTKQTDF